MLGMRKSDEYILLLGEIWKVYERSYEVYLFPTALNKVFICSDKWVSQFSSLTEI